MFITFLTKSVPYRLRNTSTTNKLGVSLSLAINKKPSGTTGALMQLLVLHCIHVWLMCFYVILKNNGCLIVLLIIKQFHIEGMLITHSFLFSSELQVTKFLNYMNSKY